MTLTRVPPYMTRQLQPLASRAAVVSSLSGLNADTTRLFWLSPSGEVLSVVRSSGATAIPDMPGWVPGETPTPYHCGALGNGTGNDAPAFADAHAITGVVRVPKGEYKFTTQCVLTRSCEWTFEDAIIDSDVSEPFTYNYQNTTDGSWINVTVEANEGDFDIVLADASAISVGQTVIIRADYWPRDNQPRIGEHAIVVAKAGNTVTLDRPLHFSYPLAFSPTFRYCNFLDYFRMQGNVTIKGKGNSTDVGIYLNGVKRVEILPGIHVTRFRDAGIKIGSSLSSLVSGPRISHTYNDSDGGAWGLGYAIQAANGCMNMIVENAHADEVGKLWDTGGNYSGWGGWVWNAKVLNSHVIYRRQAIGTHVNGHELLFQNITAERSSVHRDNDTGSHLRAGSTKVKGYRDLSGQGAALWFNVETGPLVKVRTIVEDVDLRGDASGPSRFRIENSGADTGPSVFDEIYCENIRLNNADGSRGQFRVNTTQSQENRLYMRDITAGACQIWTSASVFTDGLLDFEVDGPVGLDFILRAGTVKSTLKGFHSRQLATSGSGDALRLTEIRGDVEIVGFDIQSAIPARNTRLYVDGYASGASLRIHKSNFENDVSGGMAFEFLGNGVIGDLYAMGNTLSSIGGDGFRKGSGSSFEDSAFTGNTIVANAEWQAFRGFNATDLESADYNFIIEKSS